MIDAAKRWSGFSAWALVGLCLMPSFSLMVFTAPVGLMLAVVLLVRRHTGKEMLGLVGGVGAVIAFLGFALDGTLWLILGLALMALAVLVYRRLSRKDDRDRSGSARGRTAPTHALIKGAAELWPGFLGWTLVGISLAPPDISMMVYTVPAGLVLTAALARRYVGWEMLGLLEGVGVTGVLSNLLNRDWSCSVTSSAVFRPDGTILERTSSSCEGFGTPWLIGGLIVMALAALAYWWFSSRRPRFAAHAHLMMR